MIDRGTQFFLALLGGGFLAVPFYRAEAVRAWLPGPAAVPGWAQPAVLGLGVALAMLSLSRRGFAWADPAWLTWRDFDGRRPRVLARRWAVAWAVRFGAVAYVTAAAGVLAGWSAPAVLVVVFAGAAVGAAALTAPAIHDGRPGLVRRYSERVIRRTAVVFLDPWALLPAGRPVRNPALLAGRLVLVRFVLAGLLTRRRVLPSAVLLAAAVAVAHVLFPTVAAAWWLGIGAYCAAMPFAAPLAELMRVPGLRRWVGYGDRSIRTVAAAVLLLVVVAWAGVAVLLGVPLSASAAVAVAVAAVAVVRTVTRGNLDYGRTGVVAVFGVLVPAGLLAQVVHGPDLLLVCLVLLTSGLALVVAAAAAATLSGAALARAPG